MDRVSLSILGLSTSQSQMGAYALILQEEDGRARIPIVIGATEAQSIAIALEGLKPPRPLTHDLFLDLSNAYGIALLEVEINKIEEGVFYSKLTFKNNGNKIFIDARTSDAVALAIRFNAPIYATKAVLDKAGIVMDIELPEDSSQTKELPKKISKKTLISNLEKELKTAIEQENYEEASRIQKELAELKSSDE